jgi:HSP20 family protein
MYHFHNLWTHMVSNQYPRAEDEHIKLKENNNLYIISLNILGVKMTDIQLEATDDILNIKISSSTDVNLNEAQLLWKEFNMPNRDHQIRLPKGIDLDHASAQLNDGILKINIPKIQLYKKVISIKQATS